MYQGHQTRVADARMAISGRHTVPGAANSMPTNHPGRQMAGAPDGRGRRGDIHSTLLVTMYSASQSTWVQPTNTRRIEAVVASHSLETCACMPNAPRKHVLRWQQGPRLAAKREISHGLMREKHGGGGDGRSGGAACANRVHTWLE